MTTRPLLRQFSLFYLQWLEKLFDLSDADLHQLLHESESVTDTNCSYQEFTMARHFLIYECRWIIGYRARTGNKRPPRAEDAHANSN